MSALAVRTFSTRFFEVALVAAIFTAFT